MINVPTFTILSPYETYLGKIDNSIKGSVQIFNESFNTFLTGAAYTLSFKILKVADDAALLKEGNKLAFVYKGKDYLITIVRVEEDQTSKTILGWADSLEQTKEVVSPYAATKAMTFTEYLDIFDHEKTITLGINEVANKTLKLEWEGDDKRLGRILSLATKFDAEAEFEVVLNDDYTTYQWVLNVYKKYESGVSQGIGEDRQDVKLRTGVNVKTLKRVVDTTELYTAIRPFGNNDITISSIEYEEYDSEGKLLYYTEKGNRNILAPQARDKFPSNMLSKESDRYQALPWSYSTDSVDMLFGQALARLKVISQPNIEYTIEGFFDLNLGDTVVIEDRSYKPELILTARVSEQEICWTNPANSKTTFSNFVEEESEIADNLLNRVEEIIAANKIYTGSIQSTNGIVFKNNTGTTDLTAIVRDSSTDLSSNFTFEWFKDGVSIATTQTITVTASDINQKAVYGFEAKNAEGVLKASYEVTVSDVSDGEEGRGISSTKVEYQASTSGTTVPSGAWLTNPPTVSDGQYLWTRTTFTYTDDTTTLSYSVSRMGTTGTNGVGISDVTVTYQAGTSGTTPPTGTWTTTIPSVTANQFLWTRTVTTYTDSSTSTAYSVGKMGANGANAQLLYLSASANVMSFDSNDIVEPNQTVTITAKLQNATGTIVWTAIPYIGNAAQTPITLSGTGNSRTLTSGNWTNPSWTSVAVTATLGSLTDTISVVKVADGAAAHVHTAWKLPDGTFIMEYPNENLFSVDEWLKKPDLSSNGVPYMNISGKPSTAYTLSTNIPRITNFDVFLFKDSEAVSSATNGVDNNNPRTITTSSTGNIKVAMRNYELSSGEYWIKLEEGSAATSNVFPKWEGSYSDNLETASTSPADYEPWKIIKGQDGQSQKVHRGWKMPDGTFTKVYPNTNDLRIAQSKFFAYQGSTVSRTEGVSVPEWGATDAIRHVISGGTGGGVAAVMTTGELVKANVKYVHSAYIKNQGTSVIRINNNLSQAIDIQPNEIKRIVFNPAGNATGNASKQFVLYRLNSADVQDFILWHPKIEESTTTATVWTPSPLDDPLNAYPSLEGMYADFNEEGSNNPDDYAPWTPIRGEDGTDAKEVFSGYLTNESIVLPANPNGVVSDFSKANGNFVTFLGQDQLSTGVTYSLESATGITTTINASTGAYSITAISADIGVAIYKAVYNSITIRKQVMVVKAAQGASGVGLTTTTITYQAGTSGTTAPTGTWSATVPSVPEGQFLWTRTVWEFSDGTSKTGYSISKAGETGATGATGNGIASSAITYASSTSGTTVPSSGWQTAIPTVAEGSFLWTRTIFTYTNGNTNTSYAVAKQGEKGDPTGILSQNTVPTAAQRYVGMLWKNTGASGYINGATYRWNGSAFELYIFTAENMSVSNLAAISANLGTITAGTLNGTTINGSTFINSFTYTEGSVTYTGTTTIENGNVIISRTGSDGSTWTTKVDRTLGFEDSYKASASAPARTTRLGQGQLYMVEAGVGGYLPARSLNNTSWTNLPLASGWSAAENNPPQYRIFPQIDGSTIIKFRGQFTNTAGSMAAGSHRPFGVNSFPDIIKPNRTEFSWAPTNTRQGGRLSVTTSGDFQFQVDFTCTYAAISMLSYIIE
ncbi:hypothetical protein EC99P1_00093 [Enterococcus phage EC99P1]|nr:hypothetical protein EC99P1_00093 [Enterococcus phage EC99P1]